MAEMDTICPASTDIGPLKCGDIVCLKSGGPPMTVMVDSSDGGILYVDWFVAGVRYRGEFWPDQVLRCGVRVRDILRAWDGMSIGTGIVTAPESPAFIGKASSGQ